MRKVLSSTLTALTLLAVLISPLLQAADKKPLPPLPPLKVGDAAPDFKLQYFTGRNLKDVNLSDYRGKKNVVLAFYVFAFTGG
jgi:hypothetical protein